MIDVVRARAWRAYADARRLLNRSGSASGASSAVAGGRRAEESAWSARLAAQHDEYRSAVDPLAERVAIVCVTQRPHLLAEVFDAVALQTHRPIELVLVTNSEAYHSVDVEGAVGQLGCYSVDVTLLRRREGRTLGSCLNDALDATDARFVAKFDDDDLYGPEYLADAMRAHAYAGAAVVGKHTYYAYLASPARTVLRFPTHEFSYSSTLAGGTLVIDRALTGELRFPDISLGEDRAFLTACHRRGLSTFSADRFNFVQVRAGDNNWTVEHEDFLVATVPVADGLALDSVNI